MCGPAVTSGNPDSIDVFAVDRDGKVRWKQYAAGWSSWQLVSGAETITSDLDASEVTLSTYDVFGLGATGHPVHQHWGNGNWLSAWEDWTFGQVAVSPAYYGVSTTLTGATGPTQARAWLFTTGSTDNGLWTVDSNGTAWGSWWHLFGTLSSAPAAVSRPAATWVVARGSSPSDIIMIKDATNGDTPGEWSGFSTLPHLAGGATFSYGPCITAWSDTRLDVLAPGGGTTLWHNTSVDGGATWNFPTWEDWGGGPTIVASPDCVSSRNGSIDVVVVGADGHVWRRLFNGSANAWEDLGVY
jgi:hypothetical protein